MLKLLELTRFPLLEQLKLEEALLRNSDSQFCLLNYGAKPAYVLPASAKKEDWLHLPVPHPIIRRYTGGGCVVIDENTLFVSFIGSTDRLKESATPLSLHRHHEKLFNFIPDFKRHENDYCIQEKKVGGNAQYITKSRFVHHTSFLWDLDLEKMKGLKHPPREPHYRKKRDHLQFLTSLKSHFQTPLEFFEALKMQFEHEKISLHSVLPYTKIPYRQTSFIEL